jgi:hypothetical protein
MVRAEPALKAAFFGEERRAFTSRGRSSASTSKTLHQESKSLISFARRVQPRNGPAAQAKAPAAPKHPAIKPSQTGDRRGTRENGA